MVENPFQPDGAGPAPRGSRLGQNLVRLRRQRANGQYLITVPAGVARALHCEGGEVFEVFIERGDIILRRRDR